MTREEFESGLERMAAAASPTEEWGRAVIEAHDRLRQHPELFRGNDDHFTYNDPILSSILFSALEAHDTEKKILAASDETGSKLTNTWYRWVPTIFKTAYHRLTGSEELLASRTPTSVEQFDRDPVRLAVVGDAGYTGKPQDRVVEMILKRHQEAKFDLVIHLGDVYFAAGSDEMKKHFLAPFSALGYKGARVYTLLGNHDVYLGGNAYLSALKILDQPGRYFCIETTHWRIACIDTTLFDPSFDKGKGGMEQTQLDWLRGILSQNKPVVLMSHHYCVSGWTDKGEVLRSQLKQVFDAAKAPLAWYWGHEHVLAAYPRHADGFMGACVGNGAFLEDYSKPQVFKSDSIPSWFANPEWYAKSTCTCLRSDGQYWPHGFLEVELRNDRIQEHYYLENENAPSYSREITRA